MTTTITKRNLNEVCFGDLRCPKHYLEFNTKSHHLCIANSLDDKGNRCLNVSVSELPDKNIFESEDFPYDQRFQPNSFEEALQDVIKYLNLWSAKDENKWVYSHGTKVNIIDGREQ